MASQRYSHELSIIPIESIEIWVIGKLLEATVSVRLYCDFPAMLVVSLVFPKPQEEIVPETRLP